MVLPTTGNPVPELAHFFRRWRLTRTDRRPSTSPTRSPPREETSIRRPKRINKMLAGFKTLSVGLGLAVVPQIVSYVGSFDFVKAFGLSPNAASVIGVAMIALRA